MAYPATTDDQVASFREHGYLVVHAAIAPADLEHLRTCCDEIVDTRDVMAFDWAWEKGTERAQRDFRILQSSPTMFFPEISDSVFRSWATEFASRLLGSPVEFWYDQFLAKPPHRSAVTRWHQDEAYWGRNLEEKGITCWMPFHDVDETNGCMHFIDGGHRLGVLPHRQPDEVQSDLLYCEPDERAAVACPIPLGSVTFHHGKTPHMTPANESDEWRKILTQHFRLVGAEGEGDHYPWKVYVNQITGERYEPGRT
jgi:ectoine hydroxylase-related dioxygenase (phytanoyl-CoA dioxygenase family)